ncbi:MAG: class I SAM-dependent methyltransferase [Paludibaculum sp.]
MRSYSSGMVMRLAFSVAVFVDPDFLIIDEVLAVGDRAFQEKCVERIYQLHQAGKTILCVSHASATVRELCSRALWLEEGVLRMDGPIDEVIAAYEGGLNLRPVHLNEPKDAPAAEEAAPEPVDEVELPVPEAAPLSLEPPVEEIPVTEAVAETPVEPAEEIPAESPVTEAPTEAPEPVAAAEAAPGELDAVPVEPAVEEPAPPVPTGPPCEEELAYIRELVLNHYCFVDYQNRTIMPRSTTAALIVPIDYESVVPREKNREPFEAVTAMLEQRMWAFQTLIDRLQPFLNLTDVQFDLADPSDEVSPFWNNTFFTGMDARAAYALIRSLTPARVVEIGSGNSTRFLRKAIRDGKLATRITCIDPSPRLAVHAVADEIRTESIIQTPLDYFSTLQPGDILFFDGSHLCFHDSDVTQFFLRVLPAVPRGVLVHIHDIFLPQEYPQDFDIRYYNEQYMLAAFLLGNSNWKPLLPIHYLYGQGALNADGCSFWIVNGFVPDRS